MPLAIVNKVLLARCLGPGLFGAYVIFLRICDLAGIFSLLGTKTLTVKLIGIAAGEKDWGLLKGTLSSIFKIVLASSVGTVLLIWLIRQPLCLKIFKSPDLFRMLIFCAGVIPLQNYLALTIETYKGLQDIKTASFLPVLQQLIFFILLSLLILGSAATIQNVLLALTAGLFFAPLAGLLIFAKRVKGWPSKRVGTNDILADSLPMLVTSGVVLLMTSTDVYVLGIFSNAVQVGIYGVASSLASVTFLSGNVINQVIPAMIAHFNAKKDLHNLKYVTRYATTISAMVSVPVFLFLFLFGRNILAVLFGPQYTNGAAALSFLILGQMVNTLTGSCDYFLQMTGLHVVFMKISIFSGLLNLALNIILVQHFGKEGVAASTAFSLVVQNSLSVLVVHRKTGIWTFASLEIMFQVLKLLKRRLFF
ncbi:MAG: Polysaccharide biosynthesis protein [Desulfotomaculum sp. 46_296]|nr:MAG: Polysaccharide biosynthesis protein [Desulfotomaculum sp. 46_296]